MKANLRPLSSILIGLALLPFAVNASGTTLLDQPRMPGSTSERLRENLPHQAAWFSTGSVHTVESAAGSLFMRPGHALIAHFTPGNRPAHLAVGESLKAVFEFSVEMNQAISGSPIRIALLNSGGQRVTGDGFGNRNPLFTSYQGYGAFLSHGDTRAMTLRKRAEDDRLIMTEVAFPGMSPARPGYGTGGVFHPATTYTGTLELIRTEENKIEFSAEITGGDLVSFRHISWDLTDPVTSFDTFVFFGSGSHLDSLQLRSVQIRHYSEVRR
jgi:hypothetical protein